MSYFKYPFAAPIEVGRNLVPNPSFEVNTANWSSTTSSLLIRNTTTPYVGIARLRVESTVAGNSDASSAYAGSPVVAGTQYTLSAYARALTTSRTALIGLRFYDAGGVQVGATTTATATSVNSAWTRVSVTATAGAGAVWCSPLLRAVGTVIGESHTWDGVMLNTGATPLSYFDGSFPRSGTQFYRWLGAEHNSISVAELPGVADTLFPLIDVITPYGMDRETRTVAQELMESSSVMAAYFSPRARSGTLQVVFVDTASAMVGQTFFSNNATFYLDHSEAYADMAFVVTGGALSFERNEIEQVILNVPFKELV